jgi:hypothetical protein
MVLIWNSLACGDPEYCAILVCVNSILQVWHYYIFVGASSTHWQFRSSSSHPTRCYLSTYLEDTLQQPFNSAILIAPQVSELCVSLPHSDALHADQPPVSRNSIGRWSGHSIHRQTYPISKRIYLFLESVRSACSAGTFVRISTFITLAWLIYFTGSRYTIVILFAYQVS